MKVGEGFRQDNGKWVLARPGELPAASSAPGTTVSAGTKSAGSTPAEPAPAGGSNDILKRLIQQREKENQ